MEDAQEMPLLQALLIRRMVELGDAQGPLSARRLAERTNGQMSYVTVRAMARGEIDTITLRKAEVLASALGLSVVDFLTTGQVVG